MIFLLIRKCAAKKRKKAGGFQWRFKSDPAFANGITDIEPIQKGFSQTDPISFKMGKHKRKQKRKRTSFDMSIPVFQFDENGKFLFEYSSLKEAAKAVGRIPYDIIQCIKGKRQSSVGFQWQSINDPLFEKGIVDIEPTGERYKRSKPILQYDIRGKLKKGYRCIQDAVKKTGIPHVSIVRCIKGEYKRAGGFLWKFKNS